MDFRAGLDTVVTKRNITILAENGTSDIRVCRHSLHWLSYLGSLLRVCVFEICVWRFTSNIFVCFFLCYGHHSLFLSLRTQHIRPVFQPIRSAYTGNWTPHLRDECRGTVRIQSPQCGALSFDCSTQNYTAYVYTRLFASNTTSLSPELIYFLYDLCCHALLFPFYT